MKKGLRTLLVLFVLLFAVFPVFAEDSNDDNDVTMALVQSALSSPDYLVTAGDVYTLAYYANGASVRYTIAVDLSYKIRIANLGIIDAKGKTFLELKSEVEEIVSRNYPMSAAQLVLTSPAVYNVTLKGEVSSVHETTLSGMVRLSSLAGGGTGYSSNRFLSIEDIDGNVRRYDLFLASRFGDVDQNPYVRPGDTIWYERVDRRVSISGAVERPGTYELKSGENLRTLVFYYGGGLDILANTESITLSRTLSDISKSGEIQYLDSSVLDTDFELRHLDYVSIGSISSLKKTIFIQGAVGVSISESVSGSAATNNIAYQFETGETYNHFIKSHKAWFTDVSDYERAYVSRRGEMISIDLYSMLFDPEYENDLELEEDDILVVPFRQFFVTVSGAVRLPGRYAYVPDRTWEYYVGLAGGFDADLNDHDAMKIITKEGDTLTKDQYITPETTIDALKNSFSYKFNKVVTPLMSILSVITSTIVLINYFSR